MHDRCSDHLIAKEVLVTGRVGRICVGVLVVHGTAERNPCVRRNAGHGIDVRHELISPMKGGFGRLVGRIGILPGAPLGARVLGAV